MLRRLTDGRQTSCAWTERDRYDRLLAVCYADGRDLNAALVAAGLAVAYRRYDTRYVAVEEDAKAAGRGMWAGPFEMPWDHRRKR